jgi:hypothetical protein
MRGVLISPAKLPSLPAALVIRGHVKRVGERAPAQYGKATSQISAIQMELWNELHLCWSRPAFSTTIAPNRHA